jgi:putative transposase
VVDCHGEIPQDWPLRAERPRHVRTFDFQFDETVDGRSVKVCNILDEFTRESLAGSVERSIDADRVVAGLQQLVAGRGASEFLRMDNEPEMTAHALADWCERSGTGTVFIDPGAPCQNPFVECFHSGMRDELLNAEEFYSLAEARVVIGDWRVTRGGPTNAARSASLRAQGGSSTRRCT